MDCMAAMTSAMVLKSAFDAMLSSAWSDAFAAGVDILPSIQRLDGPRTSVQDLLANYRALFHHKCHAFYRRDVFQRVAAHRDDIGKEAWLELADLAFPS